MHIKTCIKAIYYKITGRREQFSTNQLCGVPLKVLAGTIRKKVDQDDTWWFYLAKHHNIIFDIGCNIGYTALLALIQNSDKRLFLIDPNLEALQKAAANLIQNGLANKTHFMAAFVSESMDDTIKFYTVGSGAAGSMYASHAVTAASINSHIKVKTVTLDYLAKFYQVHPELVKIDVEGAETLVMQAAKNVAKESKCSFFIEMHRVENLGMQAAGQFMLDWCQEMNYKAWYLKTGDLLHHAEEIKNRGKCHLLLLPQDKPYPEYLKGIEPHAPLPNIL